EIVGRSFGGATALPPSATTMVPGGAEAARRVFRAARAARGGRWGRSVRGVTAAQPSGGREREQACGERRRAAAPAHGTVARTLPDRRRRAPRWRPAPAAARGPTARRARYLSGYAGLRSRRGDRGARLRGTVPGRAGRPTREIPCRFPGAVSRPPAL